MSRRVHYKKYLMSTRFQIECGEHMGIVEARSPILGLAQGRWHGGRWIWSASSLSHISARYQGPSFEISGPPGSDPTYFAFDIASGTTGNTGPVDAGQLHAVPGPIRQRGLAGLAEFARCRRLVVAA
jgi:hypothetical protein